jgi:adenylate cyclase
VEEGLGLRVHYSDDLLPGGSQVITASELISGERPYEDLDGNVVVFGTHEGAAGSRPIAAPVDGGRVAPVYATANAVNTMLTGQYLRREQAGTSLAVAAVAALLAALAWVFAPWWVAAPLCAAFVLGWQRWVEARLADGRIFSLLAPVAAVATVTVIALGIAWVGRVRHRRRVRSLFARYVPGRVASRLLEGDLAEELSAGRRQDAAALFVDLRGFTPLAAMLDPAQVRQVLDRFYQFVADRVLAEDGTVVQFTGDEVYAVFGAPLARADHAKAALTVACRLQDDRAELDESLAELGVRPVGFGIGVNAGPVVAAHVGTNTRTQYSVLGDTVNVASRLCSLAAAGQIVTAAATLAGGGADATGDGDEPAADGFHPVGERSLKGVREPVALVRRGPGPLRGDPGAGADSLQVTSGP